MDHTHKAFDTDLQDLGRMVAEMGGLAEQQIVEDPILVVEVLSPTTEGIDRREKLRAYRTLPGLKEYAMVSQDECRVELHRRRGDIGWDIITFEPGDTVELASVELQLPIADIYFEAGVACSG